MITSSNKLTDNEADPKSGEHQQSHDDKQQISSKELIMNSKEKGRTNSILVTDNVTVPKQDHKSCSKEFCENSKGETPCSK